MRLVQERPTDVRERLSGLVAALEAEDLRGVSAQHLGDDIVWLNRVVGQLEAQALRRIREFDRSKAFSVFGSLSTASWLRWKCRITGPFAALRVRMARHLDERPTTGDALREGRINLQHVAVLARSAEEVGPRMAEQSERTLLEAAEKVGPGPLRHLTHHLQHCMDPDGSLGRYNQDLERRRLHLSQTWEGMFVIEGVMDGEGGSLLQATLDSLMPPPAAGDPRTAPQRRHDALVELARRQADGGRLPRNGGQLPHLTVTASLETLTRRPGSPAAELQGGLPIPAETARRLACDCSLTPLALDEQGRPVGVGRARRLISGPLRRALVKRDRHCRWPGCDRPVAWSDGHHLVSWLDGGPTSLGNSALVCRRHHVLAHEGGWQLRVREDGEVVAIAPGRDETDAIPP